LNKRVYLLIQCFLFSFSIWSQNNSDISFFNSHFPISAEQENKSTNQRDKNAIQSTGKVLFTIYQNLISSQDSHSCVFYPTCSSYCRHAIRSRGFLFGGIMTFDRLARCHGLSPERYSIDMSRRKLVDNVD